MLTESLEEVVEGTFSCPKTAQVAASITANPISGLRIRFPLPVQPARCLRLGLKYGRELESAKCTVMRHEKARKIFGLGQMGRGWEGGVEIPPRPNGNERKADPFERRKKSATSLP